MSLIDDLRALVFANPMPVPGIGHTPERHARLLAVARHNLPLARLAEAHWDAIAILAEAGRSAEPGATYGVWAAEIPGQLLRADAGKITGTKRFCTGAGLLDRALITVGEPEHRLIDLDLRRGGLTIDDTAWVTPAFAETKTATVTFEATAFAESDYVGGVRWYLERPGFWAGACGPAACWAGGAAGLMDWAKAQKRDDPHTLAHLGAMDAAVWAVESLLMVAGDEIDAAPADTRGQQVRALRLRHLIEQACVEIIERLGRAYGPHPLAFDAAVSRRLEEVQLYIRQCHAERDLEALGRVIRTSW